MWMCLSCNHLFLFIKQGFVKLNELKAVLSMLWESVLHSPSYDKTQSLKKKIFTTSALIKPSAWHLKDPELHPTMCFSCVYEAPDPRRGHSQRWKRWCKKKKTYRDKSVFTTTESFCMLQSVFSLRCWYSLKSFIKWMQHKTSGCQK